MSFESMRYSSILFKVSHFSSGSEDWLNNGHNNQVSKSSPEITTITILEDSICSRSHPLKHLYTRRESSSSPSFATLRRKPGLKGYIVAY
ncbi:hypothetical protein BDR04DRAFT_1104355 [Suillus decipiens]|nr:hypothetical protein BDR04DRAFT_1104355 [Suillus decipiens]